MDIETTQKRINKAIKGLDCGNYSLKASEWSALMQLKTPLDISGTAFLYGFLKGQRYAKKQMEIT